MTMKMKIPTEDMLEPLIIWRKLMEMRGMESPKNITKTGSWKILVNSYFVFFNAM